MGTSLHKALSWAAVSNSEFVGCFCERRQFHEQKLVGNGKNQSGIFFVCVLHLDNYKAGPYLSFPS